ncbi:hypothetical protein RBB50_002213 [Rhinocladiella similis]
MCWPRPPKVKKKMSKPFINMAFGPDNSWIIWIDASPGGKEPPHYRSSAKLPQTLERRLYGRRRDVKAIHAAAFGQDNNFILSFKSTGDEDQHLWHLPKYRNLDSWLIGNPCDKSTFWASLGPDTEFFACSQRARHWNVDEEELEEQLQDRSEQNIAGVTFGVDGCAIVLDKDGKLTEIGDVKTGYKMLHKVLEDHRTQKGKGKVVRSVALSPFAHDQYFISFADGTSEYSQDAFGTDPKELIDSLRDEYKHMCDKTSAEPDLAGQVKKSYQDCKVPYLLTTKLTKAKKGYDVTFWPEDY